MPQFRVGDRVRRIIRPWQGILVGQIYNVSVVHPTTGHIKVREIDTIGYGDKDCFELIPEEPRPGTVFYSVVYRNDPAAILKVIGFETELSFEDWMRRAPRMGYEIICKKKLTLTLPNQEA